jgi:CDP-diacylglycerol---glycerol-3-phosphate 3-phosphatidyltransferase
MRTAPRFGEVSIAECEPAKKDGARKRESRRTEERVRSTGPETPHRPGCAPASRLAQAITSFLQATDGTVDVFTLSRRTASESVSFLTKKAGVTTICRYLRADAPPGLAGDDVAPLTFLKARSHSVMLSERIGDIGKRVLDALVRILSRIAPNPNLLTFIGLLINIWCAVLYGQGRFFAAGIVMIFANLFDMFDGGVARLTNRVTRFGGFFDSVLDRYSDVIVLVGIMVFYARNTPYHSTLYVALTGIALMGSVMVSYTRARAESLIKQCKVGFLERPERVVLIIIGSLTEIGPESNPWLHKMRAVLWVLAVLSHWTVIHRMYHTFQEAKRLDALAKATVPPSEPVKSEAREATRWMTASAGKNSAVTR